MTEQEVFNLAYKISQSVAGKYGADPKELAKYGTAIAKVESNFNPSAKNKNSTARGLMQLLICTQREVEKKYAKVPFASANYSCKNYPTPISSEDKIYEPEYAMLIALNYLGYQFKRYKNWQKAVWAYNQGSYKANNQAGNDYAMKVFDKISNEDFAYNFDKNQRIEYY